MHMLGFVACLLACGSALHLHIDRQQTNIGPILGHLSTAQLDEHGPTNIIISDPPLGEFYNGSVDINEPNRFSASIISALGNGFAGVMSQWLGQLAGGVIPIIGDIGSSVAQAIAGGIMGQGGAEDNDPVEDDYPMEPTAAVQYPLKTCKPKPNKPNKPNKPHKPHKPFQKPLGYLVHVPQQGNYLVLHRPVQNSNQLPQKINTVQAGNNEQEVTTEENKEVTESTTAQQQTTEEIQQNNENRNNTSANI